MPYGMYISAEGAHAQSKRLEVIANNLANVDTVGFKRQLAVFQARYAEAVDQGQSMPGSGSLDDVGGGVNMVSTVTDFSPATTQRTGLPTDMALHGEGFFVIRRGNETYLTRAGNFCLNDRGELTTQQGDSVMSDSGSPVVLARPTEPFDVTDHGEIRQGNDMVRLAIAKTASPADLVRVGDNLFRPMSQPRPVEPDQRQVVSGCVESSGTSATTEMVELLETSRLLEANLNLLQAQDQMLGGMISRLTRTS